MSDGGETASKQDGRRRVRVIIILAAVLGLEMADLGTVSAVAGQLKQAFGISNTALGLLLAVVSFVGAGTTLPMGVLVDRTRRKTILIVTGAIWAVAMLLGGTATSYLFMLGTRLFLGAVAAAASPCVASLLGDFFPAGERARIYGLVLAGEMVGMGFGFFVAGEVSSILNWRLAFYAMVLPSIVLVAAIWRYLPEPKRGTQGWLTSGDDGDGAPPGAAAREVIRTANVEPRQALILDRDPAECSLWWATRYCLRIPSYRLLIFASALAYYFFSGFRSFGMIYFTKHYHAAPSLISALVIVPGVGALAGVIGGGRLAERMLRGGRIDARIIVSAIALLTCIAPTALAIWTTSPWLGVPMLVLGAAGLSAALAPMDAARLDIMHPRLWGRAEAGRLLVRSILVGSAPLLFGAMSTWLGGGDRGLKWTFLPMLATILAASVLTLLCRRTYPRDVATAAASMQRKAKNGKPSIPTADRS